MGPSLGESSPFEVSGILPLHGGGDGGVGRTRVSDRGWGGLFPETTAKAPRPPKAMTVQRPARRGGGGAVVTTVRLPAPPTAPKPQNTGAAQPRPESPPPAPPQGACARPAAPRRRLSVRRGPGTNVARPGTNVAPPGAEPGGPRGRFRRVWPGRSVLVTAPVGMGTDGPPS